MGFFETIVIHSKVLAALQRELQGKYDISSSIRHKGERGRSRETSVGEFLREHLPIAFAVGTGELFSFSGGEVSPQCDVIVYDNLRTPVFGKSVAVQQVPIEGTYVVIEVRSVIDFGALRDSERKFAAIRKLWAQVCETDELRKPNDGPQFMLFGFKRLASEEACLDLLKRAPYEDLTIITLDSGLSIWVSAEDPSSPARPRWLKTTMPEADVYETLTFFYFGVLCCCEPGRRPLDFEAILKSS